MTRRHIVIAAGLLLALTTLTIGCGEKTKTPAKADAGKGSAAAKGGEATAESAEANEIREAMAQLPEADRKLAEAQGVCPVGDGPLGSMGMPYKVTVKGRDVFLCCEGCKEKIEAIPTRTWLSSTRRRRSSEVASSEAATSRVGSAEADPTARPYDDCRHMPGSPP